MTRDLGRYGCTRQRFASELLARNFATLHSLARPDCPGVDAYPCRRTDRDGAPSCPTGTWHVGHPNRAAALACRAAGDLNAKRPHPGHRKRPPRPRRLQPRRRRQRGRR